MRRSYRVDYAMLERVSVAKDAIKKAFAVLRKNGFIARMNFMCCSNCASYELSTMAEKKGIEKIVFWHRQEEDYFQRTGKVALQYGKPNDGDDEITKKIGQEIVDVLKSVGVDVEWSGSPDDVIYVVA